MCVCGHNYLHPQPSQPLKMASRVTHTHFERYAQHRLDFVRNIAALSEREDYLEVRCYFYKKFNNLLMQN